MNCHHIRSSRKWEIYSSRLFSHTFAKTVETEQSAASTWKHQRLMISVIKQNKTQQIEESAIYIKKVFIRSVKTNPLEIYLFQVAGRTCDYAGHCWLAVTRRKSNRIVAQQKAFSVASLEQVWTVEPDVWCSPQFPQFIIFHQMNFFVHMPKLIWFLPYINVCLQY